MKREHKWYDRHCKKKDERFRREGRKYLHRLEGQHDRIMRRIQMTPEQVMCEKATIKKLGLFTMLSSRT